MQYFIANWKSNKTLSEIHEWLEVFELQLSTRKYSDQTRVVLAVPFPFLIEAAAWLKAWQEKYSSGKLPVQIELAAQDVSQFPAGSYTGAVNAVQLKSLGVQYVIIGHSERRRYFHESSREIAAKAVQVLAAHMTPIICVDEQYIEEQATELKLEVAFADMQKCFVTYEELAAIGTGQNTSPQDFFKAKGQILQAFGAVVVMYGGSVNSQNIREYVGSSDSGDVASRPEDAAGVLVGTASLDAQDFVAILDRAQS